MNRRVVILGLLLLVVLGGTYSTARARQVSSENQARNQSDAARMAARSALARAALAGLYASELAPFRAREHDLSDMRPPSTPPFWSVGVDRFYREQAASYRRLAGQIASAVARVTARTRSSAERALRAMDRQLARARALDLHPTSLVAVVGRAQAAYDRGSLPRDFRVTVAQLEGPRAQLERSIAAREKHVTAVLAASGNSRDGVLRTVDAEISQARAGLPLLGLLTDRASRYDSQLSALEGSVRAQSTAFAAAVKEYPVHALVAMVKGDYARTVPEKMIVVTTEGQSATLYENGRSIYSTPVTTGGPELPTDHGVFHIYRKVTPFTFHSPWPEGSPYYYPPTPIQYWMPFDGAEGLHDASWRSNFGPGSNFEPTDLGTGNYILGTHGCVNLPAAAAQYVWDWAPVGTTVVVI